MLSAAKTGIGAIVVCTRANDIDAAITFLIIFLTFIERPPSFKKFITTIYNIWR